MLRPSELWEHGRDLSVAQKHHILIRKFVPFCPFPFGISWDNGDKRGGETPGPLPLIFINVLLNVPYILVMTHGT